MTGAVQSPQPYMILQARVHLLRSQALGKQFKAQWEKNATIGDAKVYSDSTVFGDFDIYNTATSQRAGYDLRRGRAWCGHHHYRYVLHQL